MNLIEVQNSVDQLTAEVEAAVSRRDGKAYAKLSDELIGVQRKLQQLKGGEYVERLPDAAWRPCLPNPFLITDGFAVWLICPLATATLPSLCKAVLFSGVRGHSFSSINELLEGSPLHDKGLESCHAMEVFNSEWVRRLCPARHGSMETLRHFAFCFKDGLVEVIAEKVTWLEEEKLASSWLAHIEKDSSLFESVKGG